MWISYYIVIAFMILITLNTLTNASRRQRRYLLFTKGTQWGVFSTISIPLEPPEATVSVAWFFEANYYAVDNSTYLEPLLGDIEGRGIKRKRSNSPAKYFTRQYFYTLVESLLANSFSWWRVSFSSVSWFHPFFGKTIKGTLSHYSPHNFVNSRHGYHGRPCLLRAICESGTSHFLHNGVLGDILHLILTPSTSVEEDDLEDYYYEAEYRGLSNSCDYYDIKCPISPLHYISVYVKDTGDLK